jgi:hypothetical protein
VTTDDSVYTGFGFEGINESARNEFMARTLDHLGIPTDPQEPAAGEEQPAGSAPPAGSGAQDGGKVGTEAAKGRAYAKLKGVSLKGKRKARVRVAIEGDAGASVAGRVKLARGKAVYGAKRFKGSAGQVISVDVQLSRKARRALARGKALNATVVATGADSAGATINARRSVRLAAR